MTDDQKAEAETIVAIFPKEIRQLSIEYSGCGDSGEFGSLLMFDEGNTEVHIEIDEDIAHRAELFLQKLVDFHHPGWCNDDGASGCVTTDLHRRTISIDHDIVITDIENLFHRETF